jgi:hypothetical protein
VDYPPSGERPESGNSSRHLGSRRSTENSSLPLEPIPNPACKSPTKN